MDRTELAGMIDHSYLKADAAEEQITQLCTEAVQYGFAMAAVNSCQAKLCSTILKGTGVHTGAAVGFPLGQQTVETKAFETEDAIRNGADEIDYVINLTMVKAGDYSYIRKELQTILDICRKNDVLCKMIIETCYLTRDEIIRVCEIAGETGPDYVKTSTGFGTAGAKAEDVRLMKCIVGSRVKVKAAGGIRTLRDALDMIEAGAERIGTSSGIRILEEFERAYPSVGQIQ